jgi:hypothetical protein
MLNLSPNQFSYEGERPVSRAIVRVLAMVSNPTLLPQRTMCRIRTG